MSTVTADRTPGPRPDRTVPDRVVSDLAALVFCSALQPSQAPGSAAVCAVVQEGLGRGEATARECAAEVAASYGDDPESACRRMRWARAVVMAAFFAGRAAA